MTDTPKPKCKKCNDTGIAPSPRILPPGHPNFDKNAEGRLCHCGAHGKTR